MTKVFMSHRVVDHDRWRAGYDADAPRRAAAGFTEVGVFRGVGDPDYVLIAWTHPASPEELQAMLAGMLADPGIAAAMRDAGVADTPKYWVGPA